MNSLLTVSGTVTVNADPRDDVEIPDDAILTVKLVGDGGEVLAATALPAAMTTEYSLVVDSVLVPEPKHLRLWAMLRTDTVGVWGTPELAKLRDDIWLSRVDI